MTTNNGNVPLVPGMTANNPDMLVPQVESQAQETESGEAETGTALTLEERFEQLQTQLAKSESDRKAAEGRLKSGKLDDTSVNARFDQLEQRMGQTQQLVVAGQQQQVSPDIDTFNETVDTINKEAADSQTKRDWEQYIEARNDEIHRIARDTEGKWILNPQQPELADFAEAWTKAYQSEEGITQKKLGISEAMNIMYEKLLDRARGNVTEARGTAVEATQRLDDADIYDTHSGGSTSATAETDSAFLQRFGDPNVSMSKTDVDRAAALMRAQGINI